MDMSKKLPCCDGCGGSFRPDRYNVHHQKYCTRPDCVRERRRKRQREWYGRRCAEDPEFVAAARVRCAAANRRRRTAERSRPGPPGALPLLSDVVVGMLSQLTDTADPVQLRACMHDYAARGQRMALAAPAGTDPP